MYIAAKKIKGKIEYVLRESVCLNEQMIFRDIFNLGQDPSDYINYIGQNAFYFDEIVEDNIRKNSSKTFDSDELEDLLWPWIKPDVKEAIYTFRDRSFSKRPEKLTETEKVQIDSKIHYFDKRRTHYLKFGNMDQGLVENMSPVLFRHLLYQSRDEIEQSFFSQEARLKPHERKTYVYTVFDLQSHFASFMAKKMPHVLDQEKVDEYFLKKICQINEELFNKTDSLDDYMIRFVIMFFDNPYADSELLDEFAKEFINRHRNFRPSFGSQVSTEKACRIFNISRSQLKHMSRKKLTKLYRKLAMDYHPDIGGSHEKFIELGNAYKSLLEQIA